MEPVLCKTDRVSNHYVVDVRSMQCARRPTHHVDFWHHVYAGHVYAHADCNRGAWKRLNSSIMHADPAPLHLTTTLRMAPKIKLRWWWRCRWEWLVPPKSGLSRMSYPFSSLSTVCFTMDMLPGSLTLKRPNKSRHERGFRSAWAITLATPLH